MRTRLLATVGLTAALVVPTLVAPCGAPAGAADPLGDAVAWLADQQQADGGFDVAGFPGFETPDAVLALAATGQTGAEWDTDEALAAVEAVTTGGETPKDALDALDDWVDDVQLGPNSTPADKAQQAAKVIALVIVPLGLDATDFDPAGDSGAAVDLQAALGAGGGVDGDYATLPFAGRAYALWALAALGTTAPPNLVADVLAAQAPNGSWNYQGDPELPGFDVDTTAIVAIALSVAGTGGSDVSQAAAGLGLRHTWDGEWPGEFDDGNPNSTALVMLMARTRGSDPDTPCWRDANEIRANGVPYPSPVASIERRQVAEGRITSPNDGWGINTFATSQAIQGLAAAEGAWPYTPPGDCPSFSLGDHRRLVNAHYADLLGRYSDEAGADYWEGQLAGGAAPALVSKRLTGTPEYGRRVASRLAERYLGRPATAPEYEVQGQVIRRGGRLDVAAAILGSQEYFEGTVFPPTEPTNATWIDAVYPDTVGRPADVAGRAWALGQLEAGRTRTQVARTLLGSTEGLRLMVTGFYNDLLRRGVDPAGRDFWVGQIRQGRSPEGLVLLIAGSGEYVAKTAAPA
jgi:hypothetical protein